LCPCRARLDPDAAPLPVHDFFADCEADACSRIGFFLRGDALKYLENLFEIARLDADAVV
jgi:hypothetical protein